MTKRMAAMASKVKTKAVQTVQRLTAWSYSRWTDYEKCPAYCKYKNILKMKEPDNEAMAKGSATHKIAEQYTLGQLKKFPAELGAFSVEFKALKDAKATTEQEWAFNSKYERVDWFARDAWLRIKVDACYLEQVKAARGMVETTVHIRDHKTGKNKVEHEQQRSLYALGGFLMYPDAAKIVVEHWYLDSGEIEPTVFKASELPALKKQWEQRTRAMLQDTTFAPRPGAYCRWCFYSKGKGGPCSF